MRIIRIGAGGETARSRSYRRDVTGTDDNEHISPAGPSSCAVVAPVQPGERLYFTPPRAPQATFIAQLIAMAIDAPQTRLKRRACEADAIAAYKATGVQVADQIRPAKRYVTEA